MSEDRIARWNERYAAGEGRYDMQPSAPLPAAIEGVRPGVALDLACGAGRHAIFLAERGWRVVAIDGSHVAVDLLRREAERRGLEIDTRVCDLRGYPIEPASWDLICDFYYLDRALFDGMRAGVRPGSLLAAAIHVDADPGERLLSPGELRGLAEGWELLHYREGPSAESGHRHWTAELVARRPTAA